MKAKPPVGITPEFIWRDQNPNPTLSQLLTRFLMVGEAITRYRAAGLKPREEWLVEIGIITVGRKR